GKLALRHKEPASYPSIHVNVRSQCRSRRPQPVPKPRFLRVSAQRRFARRESLSKRRQREYQNLATLLRLLEQDCDRRKPPQPLDQAHPRQVLPILPDVQDGVLWHIDAERFREYHRPVMW